MLKPSTRILLVGGGPHARDALHRAFIGERDDIDIFQLDTPDDALEAMASERLQLCIVRAQSGAPEATLKICEDAREAGLHTPIIVLFDTDSANIEHTFVAAGALAAMPWDGSQDAMLRNFLRITLSLRASEENLRQSSDRLVMEMRTLQDQRERAEALNVQYLELAENYAHAKEELEKLNQEKTKFFSIIAHDLRSPFTALLGFSELLSLRADMMDPSQVRDAAQNIHQAGHRVFALLENLLEWSRLQMGRITVDPQTISLADIAGETLEVLEPVAAEKGVLLNQEDGAQQAFADPNMISAVIRNLVNNAIKFTPSGGRVTVSFETCENTDGARGEAYVHIIDTGVGISAERAAKLFELSQSVSTQGTNGEFGTGLGLLMCKELVESNHGRIHVTSEEGCGSTFSVMLPLEAPRD